MSPSGEPLPSAEEDFRDEKEAENLGASPEQITSTIGGEPAEVEVDGGLAPPEIVKLKSVLRKCKSQAPIASSETKDLTRKFSNEYFFPKDGGMVFKVARNKKRSELRQFNEWRTNTEKRIRMVGVVNFPTEFSLSMQRYTFMQIHGHFAPLIRIAAIDRRKGKNSYLWAVIRSGLWHTDVRSYPLVQRPQGHFKCESNVKMKQMLVLVNDTVVADIDVSSWENYRNYFKAGGTSFLYYAHGQCLSSICDVSTVITPSSFRLSIATVFSCSFVKSTFNMAAALQSQNSNLSTYSQDERHLSRTSAVT